MDEVIGTDDVGAIENAPNLTPEIVEILAVTFRASDEFFIVQAVLQYPNEGAEPEEVTYILSPTDQYGIAPAMRLAVTDWINNGGDLQDYVAPPPPPLVIALGDFWSRLTDEEAEEFDGAMTAKPIRLRRLYQAEQTAYSDGTELFDAVSSTLVDLFGEARKDALFGV